MKISPSFLAVWLLLLSSFSSRAEELPIPPPLETQVATVLGQPVFYREVRPNEETVRLMASQQFGATPSRAQRAQVRQNLARGYLVSFAGRSVQRKLIRDWKVTVSDQELQEAWQREFVRSNAKGNFKRNQAFTAALLAAAEDHHKRKKSLRAAYDAHLKPFRETASFEAWKSWARQLRDPKWRQALRELVRQAPSLLRRADPDFRYIILEKKFQAAVDNRLKQTDPEFAKSLAKLPPNFRWGGSFRDEKFFAKQTVENKRNLWLHNQAKRATQIKHPFLEGAFTLEPSGTNPGPGQWAEQRP